MEKKDIYDMFRKSEKYINLMHIEQDKSARKQFGDSDYLDVAHEACQKFNSEFGGVFDSPMPRDDSEDDLTPEEIKSVYNLQDDDIVLRITVLKSIIKTERQKSVNYNELLAFLKSAMNYDEMQIWLMKKQMEGAQLTFNDELKKFFELYSNDDILKLYDIEQNYDENNINGIKKVLEKRKQVNDPKK